MVPRALLFTSDGQASALLAEVLSQLGIGLELCGEIFAAVERLTASKYDVIIADWQQELEASFLVKTVHDLTCSRTSFVLAIVEEREVQSALAAAADGVLIRPLTHEQIRKTLTGAQDRIGITRSRASQPALPDTFTSRPIYSSANAWAQTLEKTSGSVAHGWISARPRPQQKQGVGRSQGEKTRRPARRGRARFTLSIALIALLATGSIRMMRSGRSIAHERLDRMRHFLIGSERIQSPKSSTPEDMSAKPAFDSAQQDIVDGSSALNSTLSGIRVKPILHPPKLEQVRSLTTPIPMMAHAVSPDPIWRTVEAGSSPQIPQSLWFSSEELTGSSQRTQSPLAPAKWSPKLITVPESVSRTMLLEQKLPIYPQPALEAGLQGAVVLVAHIGKDGAICDLKLVQGSLILGKAAAQAVQQWRYKPYRSNGEIVDIETTITIDFQQP